MQLLERVILGQLPQLTVECHFEAQQFIGVGDCRF